MRRTLKIEEALADWFRVNTEFSVSEGFAVLFMDNGEDGPPFGGREINVDLKRLAEELDQQFDRIGDGK